MFLGRYNWLFCKCIMLKSNETININIRRTLISLVRQPFSNTNEHEAESEIVESEIHRVCDQHVLYENTR